MILCGILSESFHIKGFCFTGVTQIAASSRLSGDYHELRVERYEWFQIPYVFDILGEILILKVHGQGFPK